MQPVHLVENRRTMLKNCIMKITFLEQSFSFTVTSQEKLENLKFSVEIDGTVKEYSVRYNYYPLLTEVWILEGDETVYYSENPAIASPYYKDQNPFAF